MLDQSESQEIKDSAEKFFDFRYEIEVKTMMQFFNEMKSIIEKI